MYERKIEPYLVSLGDRFMHYTPRLIAALIFFVVGLWVVNRLSKLIAKAMHREKLDSSLQSFLSSLINIGLKIFLLITVAEILGIQTTSLVAVMGAAGLAVGLALQGSLSNFAGGVLILIFKPYKVGDTIEAQGQTGTVTEIQIFNTILLTGNNKTVILPNGAVSNGTIVNQSRFGNLRGEFQVVVTGDSDLARVRSVILAAVNANPKVLKTPAATVDVVQISGGITLAVKPYAMASDLASMMSEVQEAVNIAIRENNIQAPIPATITINRNG